MRMRHIVICGLSGTTVIFHITYKGHYFLNKVIEYKIGGFIFSTASLETFLVIRSIEKV